MVRGHLEWNDRLAVGVGGLDDAHREIIDLYNRLAWACENDTTVSNVRERIRSFLLFARWHFEDEERWMRRIRYPDYVAHKADHARLLQDAGDFVESFGSALHRDDGHAIASYFRYWLIKHMSNKDRALKDFLDSSTSLARGTDGITIR